MNFVSRAGEKLQFAIEHFKLDLHGLTCADFGSSTGGFTDCMLKNGAKKVYSVDTCYGELDYGLRKDPRVVVFERNNAMHVTLPEKVDLLSIDLAWTKQEKVIPNAIQQLKIINYKSSENLSPSPFTKGEGWGEDLWPAIISLVKTNYEANRDELSHAVVKTEFIPEILKRVEKVFEMNNLEVIDKVVSPIKGKRAENEEWIYLLQIRNKKE